MLSKIKYVLILFIIETILQILYLSIRIKLFEDFLTFHTFLDVLLNTSYVIGSLKAAFCLPAYLLFYLRPLDTLSPLKISIQHSLIFLIIYLFSLFFVFAMGKGWYDVILLTTISFVSSLLLSRSQLARRMQLKRQDIKR